MNTEKKYFAFVNIHEGNTHIHTPTELILVLNTPYRILGLFDSWGRGTVNYHLL